VLGPTDASVYRALFPEGEARFWSSRVVVDPRLSASEISRRSGLSRSTVQVRLWKWRRMGFLTGYEVWPNPKLFGAQLAVVDTSLGRNVSVDGMLESLSKVEGVLSARDYLDDHGRSVRIYVVDDGPTGLERRSRLIQHISGSSRRLRAEPYWIPDPPGRLTALDWRIIACSRAYPEDSLLQTSARLGISPRTVTRRRDRLIDSHALWWLLSTENSKLPIADLFVRLRDPSRNREVRQLLDHEIDGWIPCAADGFGQPPGQHSDLIAGLAIVDSPALLDRVSRRVAASAAVVSVRWRIPCGLRSFPEWFDRGIRAHVGQSVSGTFQSSSLLGASASSILRQLPSLLPVSFGDSSRSVPTHLPNARSVADSAEYLEGPTTGVGRRK